MHTRPARRRAVPYGQHKTIEFIMHGISLKVKQQQHLPSLHAEMIHYYAEKYVEKYALFYIYW